jgi:hypothetical protein
VQGDHGLSIFLEIGPVAQQFPVFSIASRKGFEYGFLSIRPALPPTMSSRFRQNTQKKSSNADKVFG